MVLASLSTNAAIDSEQVIMDFTLYPLGVFDHFSCPYRVNHFFLTEPKLILKIDAADVVPQTRLHLDNASFQVGTQLASHRFDPIFSQVHTPITMPGRLGHLSCQLTTVA